MKILCLSVLIMFSLLFTRHNGNNFTKSVPPVDSVLIKLKNKRAAVDQYIIKHSKALTLLVKVPGKTKLKKVINENWPEEMEYTYNILKDTAGRIILVSLIPFSQSGDWSITYTHYFDEKGNTYAFRKQTNVFDSEVKGGVIYETLLKYYDVNFNILKKTYTLQDKSGKPIKNNGHVDIYQYKYGIYKNLDACLKDYHITSAN
jgi:hypothetical protein